MKKLIYLVLFTFLCVQSLDAGTIWMFGKNSSGQLGCGTNKDTALPVYSVNYNKIKYLASGGEHSGVLLTTGAIWAWGRNTEGQLGDGSLINKNVPSQPAIAQNWMVLAMGRNHTVALKVDGTLWAWGANDAGQLGDGTNYNKNQATQIGTQRDWYSIKSYGDHTMAVKTDGTLWAWGANNRGQLGAGLAAVSVNTPVKVDFTNPGLSVFCGAVHTIAIKSDGSLWAWGANDAGQLGDDTKIDKNLPVQIGKDSNWSVAACGNNLTMAIKTDGSLWAWGSNDAGQFGDGTTIASQIPKRIGNSYEWQSISIGTAHTLALKKDGTLWAWGANDSGQLGDGTLISKLTPTQVGVSRNWKNVVAGANHSIGFQQMGKPEQISPENLAINNPIINNFSWLPVEAAVSYRIQISLEPTFAKLTMNLKTTSYANVPSSKLAYETTYYWRVKAYSDKDSSDWSNSFSFKTVVAPPSKPVLFWPQNLSTNQSINPEFNWSSTGSTKYRLVVAKDKDCKDLVIDVNTTTMVYIPTQYLINNYEYFWKVKAYSATDSSEWSDLWEFNTTHIPLGVFNLYKPTNNLVNVPFTTKLEWTISANAVNYRVQLATDADFNDLITNSLETKNFKDITGLKNNTKYYWRVKSYSDLDSTLWTDVWNFNTINTDLSKVVLIAPVDSSTNLNTNVLLEWSAGAKMQKYRVQVSRSATFDTLLINSLELYTLMPLSGLANDTKYYWRVKGYSLTDSSIWSNVWSFSTKALKPATVVLYTPKNESANIKTSPTLIWNSAENASYYILSGSFTPDFKTLEFYNTVQDTVYSLANLKNNTKYYWRVRSTNVTYYSDWSDVWNFTTEHDSGVDEESANKFIIKPNPANNQLNLSWDSRLNGELKINIYNSIGELAMPVNTASFTGEICEQTLDVSDLQSGSYRVVIESQGRKISKAFNIIK